jgi:prevent-host-death family protein
MYRTITTSDLRTQIKRVLNEVGYGQARYVIERFGEPTAAIVSMEDFRLIQEARREQAGRSLRQTLDAIRGRNRQLDGEELGKLIAEAREEYYQTRSSVPNGS